MWTDLLEKHVRKIENSATVHVIGSKHCGKKSILSAAFQVNSYPYFYVADSEGMICFVKALFVDLMYFEWVI